MQLLLFKNKEHLNTNRKGLEQLLVKKKKNMNKYSDETGKE